MEQSAIPEDVEVIRDVVYGSGGGRELHLHIVRPKQRRVGLMPAVVFVHGGFWMGGTRDRGLERLPALAHRGYFGVTIEYRLTQEATFPAQVEDCKCAVRYLRAHADEYGIDPDRIGAWGGSAGGHLVAMLGLTSDVAALEGDGGWPEQSSRIQAVVDMYGIADLLRSGEGYPGRRGADGNLPHPDEPDSPESKLIGGPVQEHKDDARFASPTTYVTVGSPPFLVVHGTGDLLVHYSQSELLHARLQKAGVESELVMYPDAGHMFIDAAGLEKVYAFFDKHLMQA